MGRVFAFRPLMVYLPLLVFVAVAFWIAGWRKGLKITIASAFLCLLFGLWFHPTVSSAEMREVPHNLWVVVRGVIGFPVYLILHPSEWLYLLVPIAVFIVLYVVFAALRELRKKAATRN